ncbi:CDP-glycerol glycerophosphotransferase family protein [Desulfovibrio sp. OttesenSCG-928-M16]|nr:CDP-glycerol glycerophosphotransferase family protein [Desulfovibrio sp. OttesenSCG-928-M16]
MKKKKAEHSYAAFSEILIARELNRLAETVYKMKFDHQSSYLEFAKLLYEYNKIPLHQGEKIRIHFLFFAPSFWPACESVYRAFSQDADVEVGVVYLHADPSRRVDTQRSGGRAFLEENNIPYIDYKDYDIAEQKPHIIVYQTPYNDVYEEFPGLKCDRVTKLGVRAIYISYGIEYDKSVNTNHLVNIHHHHYVQCLAWKVFVMHNDIKDSFAQYCRLGSSHVEAMGAPKMDAYFHKKTSSVIDKIKEYADDRKVVAIFIHHPNNHESLYKFRMHSIQFSEHIKILNYLSKQHDFYFVVTLHPRFLTTAVRKLYTTSNMLDEFKNIIEQSSNIYLYSSDYQNLVSLADAFITEQSSVMIEMGMSGKPVLYLYDEPLPLKNFAEQIAESYYHGKTVDDVYDYIDLLRTGKDVLREKRNAIKQKFLETHDGDTGYRIYKNIKESLLSECRASNNTVPGVDSI